MELDQNSLEETFAIEAAPSTATTVEATTPTSESSAVRFVTQSKFFSPAFNAAIFDGPIRIYFAQYQEAQALKLYHNLQERFGEVRKHARGIFKDRGRNIFVMLYPTEDLFVTAFSEGNDAGASVLAQPVTTPQILQDRLGGDFVLGVCGPMEDEGLDTVCERMDSIVHSA